MDEVIYTLATWRVKPGRESEFVEAWLELGLIFNRLPQPPIGKGKLLQSLTDPLLYYSFGPWSGVDAIEAMRANSSAQEGIGRLVALCDEAQPGGYRLVAEA